MAKLERKIGGDFNELKSFIELELPGQSMTFSWEESFEGIANGKKYWVATGERYAAASSNRSSVHITLLEEDDGNHVMATGSGGSTAMMFKINKWSEQAFLDTLEVVLTKFEAQLEG